MDVKSVKILIIGHTGKMGGVETFIRNTTLFSDKDKVQFDFLIHGDKKCLFAEEFNSFYNNRNHIYFLPKFKKNPMKTIAALWKFYKEHHEYKYIHLETGAAAELLYCFPYYLFYGMKVIIHSHNGGNSEPKLLQKVLIPLVNVIADKKLACSDAAAVFMFGKMSAPEAKLIYNGIDADKFRYSEKMRKACRESFRIEENALVIGHIGRFSKQKNHSYLIEIFQEIYNRQPNAVLVLGGTGELEEDIKEKVKRYKLQSKVIFTGLQEDTSALYSAMDVFVMPSLYEGLPIVAIEAQASGLPCVFSNKISIQVRLTEQTEMAALEEGARNWADRILSLYFKSTSTDRYKGVKAILNKGYDIHDTVSHLERIYLS
jgi:glycosyltransferase involved in cell wall biosynthesis